MRRTALLLLCLTGCGAEHHARQVALEYRTALAHDDIPATTRLGSTNMRALLNEHYFTKDEAIGCVDEVLKHTVRVVKTPHAVALIGWVKYGNQYLYPLLVGEPASLREYALVHQEPAPSSTDWQVSMPCTGPFALRDVRDASQIPAVNEKLSKINDQLLSAWLFEGSNDAGSAVHDALK